LLVKVVVLGVWEKSKGVGKKPVRAIYDKGDERNCRKRKRITEGKYLWRVGGQMRGAIALRKTIQERDRLLNIGLSKKVKPIPIE